MLALLTPARTLRPALGVAARLGPRTPQCGKRTFPRLESLSRFLAPTSQAVDPEKLRVPSAPETDVRTHRLAWGGKHSDPYGYLEDVDDPRTKAYLSREETFTAEMAKLNHGLKERLLDDMERLNALGKESPAKPTRIGKWNYYTRNFRNIVNPRQVDSGYYRMKVAKDDEGAPQEEKLLDTRQLRWRGFTAGKMVVAPNPDYFAYTVRHKDGGGTETAELWVNKIGSNGVVDTITIIPQILNFVWSGDSKSIYYTVLDERLRSSKVIVRSIEYEEENRVTGEHPRQRDRVVYDERNPHWFVDISRSKDDRYVVIHSGSLTSSEVHLVDAQAHYNPLKRPDFFPRAMLIEARQPNVEYFVDHHERRLFILTNRGSPNQFRLMTTSVDQPRAEYWREWIKLQPAETIEDVDIFENYVVTYGRRQALPFVQVHCLRTQDAMTAEVPALATEGETDGRPARYEVALPEKYSMVRPVTNPAYDTNVLKFSFNSPFTSELTVEYDLAARTILEVDGRQLQNFNGQDYQIIRSYVSSHDGLPIPVTLIAHQSMVPDGTNPLLLHAYGAYGTSMEVEFRPEMLPLLERGWIVALAHVRGGSDLGRQWYLDGKLDKKTNSIRDLLAVADWLVDRKYTSPAKQAVTGTSAGGLVVGAAINQRPDLFRAALLHVPFVDVVNTMINPDLPLTQVEYLEWGNPSDDREVYQLMKSYSPYENIPRLTPQAQGDDAARYPAQNWPSVMATVGMRDQRVMYWQTLKWAAKLRNHVFNQANTAPFELEADEAPKATDSEITYTNAPAARPRNLFLKVDRTSGHFDVATKSKRSRWEQAATELAFLVSEIEDSPQ
ncbi:hypothetical protein IWQ60_000068 [Tieghemiomyces parasiticus]|uniref:Prolyl endopeptidase n=1 Tax=Tieghemiomyces parasiticus TaxID=78921 RepID=A0A9W8E3S3_9FUNG|nr:hypothetical protein IWQ60_000068 [Tieghemiomyces parasiticus]